MRNRTLPMLALALSIGTLPSYSGNPCHLQQPPQPPPAPAPPTASRWQAAAALLAGSARSAAM